MRTRTFGDFSTSSYHDCRYGGSLMIEMPNARHETIKKVLGTSLAKERKEKYSSSITVKHNDTGFLYRVYMSSGEWRIGSVNTSAHVHMEDNGTYNEIGQQLQSILEQ